MMRTLEFSRAAKPHCWKCGGTILFPVCENTSAEIQLKQRLFTEADSEDSLFVRGVQGSRRRKIV